MVKRAKRAEPRPASRLYLVTPPVADAAAFSPLLAQTLAAGDVAAVLLRLASGDERELINRVKALAPPVQDEGAALLLDGRSDLVARAGADGAHLTGIETFAAERERLQPGRIAGCGGLLSRHDAMLAAEAGADYVMFGEPDATGGRPAFAAIEERVAWWAEVFEAPCVAYAAGFDEVTHLARAGADFVALGEWLWRQPGQTAALLASAAALLCLPETAA
jgi:thiamine-phosphate pyrophosphorylase